MPNGSSEDIKLRLTDEIAKLNDDLKKIKHKQFKIDKLVRQIQKERNYLSLAIDFACAEVTRTAPQGWEKIVEKIRRKAEKGSD
jgi:hypothetical protein